MLVLLNCLGCYAGAAALVIGAENYLKALDENCRPRVGWPVFFATVAILAFILASQ